MIKSFEGGRGIAAVFVALFHLGIGASFVSPLRNGYLFVDLFFVLSGFLIYSVYSKQLENTDAFKPFIIRRFGRLFPLLVFATVAYVAGQNLVVFVKSMAVMLGYSRFFREPGLLEYSYPNAAEIVSTLSLTHGLGLFDKLILNYASWSISTEFYAYLLFASLCFLTRGRIRLAIIAMLAVLGYLLTVWASVDLHDCLTIGRCFDVSYDFGFARCVSAFFLGGLVSHFVKLIDFNANRLQIIGLVALTALFWAVDDYPILGIFFPGVFAILIVSISKDTGFLAELLKCRPFQILGERSYSIYLMHPVVLLPLMSYRDSIKGVAMSSAVLVAYLAVLWVVSGLTYRFVENPFRIIFNRIARGFALPRPIPLA